MNVSFLPRGFERLLPYIRRLIESNVSKGKKLKSLPDYVTCDIRELICNIMIGNCSLTSAERRTLRKHDKISRKLARIAETKSALELLYKQNNEFYDDILSVLANKIKDIRKQNSHVITFTTVSYD